MLIILTVLGLKGLMNPKCWVISTCWVNCREMKEHSWIGMLSGSSTYEFLNRLVSPSQIWAVCAQVNCLIERREGICPRLLTNEKPSFSFVSPPCGVKRRWTELHLLDPLMVVGWNCLRADEKVANCLQGFVPEKVWPLVGSMSYFWCCSRTVQTVSTGDCRAKYSSVTLSGSVRLWAYIWLSLAAREGCLMRYTVRVSRRN